jgi:hypothetical protein
MPEASIFEGIDTSDPCAVWPVMQRALDRLLVGESVARARFGDDDVEFGRGSITVLERRIAELKAACEARTTGRVRRHAIRGGFVRT